VTAQARGWGTGWPRCQFDKVSTIVRSDGLRLPMRDEVIPMVEILLDRTEASGYDVRPGETWGMACRAVRGTNTASNHSWGLAVDINAPANPMASADWHRRNANRLTSTRPFGLQIVTDLTETAVTLWETAGWRWGGRYQNRPDPMHFEFMGTPSAAAKITGELTHGGPPTMADSATAAALRAHHVHVDKSDKHTRTLIREEAEKTRVGTVKALAITAAKLKEDLTLEMGAQTDRIIAEMETLAGDPDAPIALTPSDVQHIARAVIEEMRAYPLTPTPTD